MSLKFCSFSSGSSGNSYMVKSDETVLLVDVGISGKKIFNGLDLVGIDPDEVNGILITHEHSDHIKSLKVVSKKSINSITYSNLATWEHIKSLVPEDRQIVFQSGEAFRVGDILVKPFKTSHDAAESVGFSFYIGEKQISIVTDTGCISKEVFEEIKTADLLALEANHDVNVLRMCSYPYHIKRRILSDEGHLSNEAAANCICQIVHMCKKPRRVLLSHLSRENNIPEMAELTVRNMLEEEGIIFNENLSIEVITKDVVSALYEV